MKNSWLIIIIFFAFFSCKKEPSITDAMLDGKIEVAPSVLRPDSFLISLKYPNPSSVHLQTPVIIACHGYSATTFEWQELVDWIALENKNAFVSQVLLGAHGTSYEDFQASTWEDWQSSIVEEFNALKSLGYTNINFVGSSTSGPLLLDLINKGTFGAEDVNQFFLIDPIVISGNKTLSLAKIVGPMIGYIDTEQDASEDKYWYHFRPQETLVQLEELTNQIRKDLQKGINLPDSSNLVLFKSLRDDVADPFSAILIEQGLYKKDQVEVKMIDSDLHVFTRLSLRTNLSTQDYTNQNIAFTSILERIQ